MRPDQWPHQFVKDGSDYVIGKNALGVPITACRMRCVHCSTTYLRGEQSMPNNACPRRYDKREMSRLKR